MEAAAQVQTWEVDRENLVIREVGAGGLPLFEVLSATAWADAHLAAAAPAMLAALESAVSDFDNWGEVWQSEGGPDGEDVFTVLEACRAALALARGEVVRP